MPYIPNTDADREEMLRAIGVTSFEELLKMIPEEIRLRDGIKIPSRLSEFEVIKELKNLESMNTPTSKVISFLGGGSYDHYVPSAIGAITSRSEFYTAYTPYQAEVSQGTLQAIYEYQTMVCELTGMDISNASMYDGGSALGEAALLAVGHTGRDEIIIAGKIHPHYMQIIRTYCEGQDIIINEVLSSRGSVLPEKLKTVVTEKTAAVIVQQPNFYGCLEDVDEIGTIAHEAGGLYIVSVDPISLGLLAPPGSYGADIVVGEGQVFGNAQNFGGPYLGIFAAKDFLLRKIPGRISGITVDADGQRGFVLTVQTREQHIRRDKATSNICTNQALVMLAATVYLSLLGKKGIQEVADQCLQKAHYLSDAITAIAGFRLKFNRPFFKEFVVETPVPPLQIINQLTNKGILSGIDVKEIDGKENGLLIAVTEKRTKSEMDRYVSELAKFV
ncbi:MAG: aminomethyl-transferring glycine dehydrogenase subunit GcvPA [Bacteroidetes bacterium]|nr:aminomethyl-transferring glycine dehydrogenase subunit GcvPA [Bacteroidota bacterium]MBU1423932.1 aminomethyl-transferring glycine dehydrogenase subunit GcvPA [Bacteroidota bacterium]MBU2635509.1 aminomethyl-transferring glycine dehydrogenase subunit GcvPA [Bacteroidota bacterium]